MEPIYFHIVLNEGKEFSCDVPAGHNSFIYLLKGELKIGEKKHDKTIDSNLILLERGTSLKIKSNKKSELLFMYFSVSFKKMLFVFSSKPNPHCLYFPIGFA